MTCQDRLQEFLASNGASFESEHHRLAYTAQEVAAAEHVPGKEVAKVVVAVVDGGAIMLALPADRKVDLDRLRFELGASEVRLAREEEFAGVFPDCEVGAMPPFGNLYGLPVYVERSLARAPEIIFQAGTHTETIKMRYDDFDRLVHPEVKDFAFRL